MEEKSFWNWTSSKFRLNFIPAVLEGTVGMYLSIYAWVIPYLPRSFDCSFLNQKMEMLVFIGFLQLISGVLFLLHGAFRIQNINTN
jgi:uncharacterized membrane protein YbhN (UPF0104 family)